MEEQATAAVLSESTLYQRRDKYLLFAATFCRAAAVGLVAVVIAIHLKKVGLSPSQIGIVIGLGLAGACTGIAAVTIYGDRLSRRAQLVLFALITSVGTMALAYVHSFPSIVALAFFGMLNGMGRDRGPLLVVEQAVLPATCSDDDRTFTFAWYNLAQDIGHAVGGLLAGIPALLVALNVSLRHPNSDQLVLLIYSALLMLCALFYLFLSPSVAAPASKTPEPVSAETKTVVWRISALFAIDAIGGGFLTTALVSLFLFERFQAPLVAIAGLFFLARVANALSHLGAALLSKQIGLVNTMVLTHIPSSLVLATVPFAPDFWTAALLFLVRESLVEMDVPTRQSYVMAMVKPHERAFAAGITNLVRVGGWAIAPLIASLLLRQSPLYVPILVGCFLKVLYDLLLWYSFHKLKPPEEAVG